MQKRKFDELISYFNRKVSEMEIGTSYKMELLGMVTALGYAHEKETEERKTGRWIPCGKCIHADGKHRWCKILDRSINEDYFCYWAESFRKEGEADG